MSSLEVWIMAVGLAMDCMAVSIASGILLKRFRARPMLTLSFFFGLFQGFMPLVGWAFFRLFSHYVESFDHWIAFAVLFFLGLRMIRQGNPGEEATPYDPTNVKTVIALSVATSIDALVIGISFACLGIKGADIVEPVGIIAFVSFLLSLTGFSVGILCGRRSNFRAELLGGIILIGIGTKILVEHLFY